MTDTGLGLAECDENLKLCTTIGLFLLITTLCSQNRTPKRKAVIHYFYI